MQNPIKLFKQTFNKSITMQWQQASQKETDEKWATNAKPLKWTHLNEKFYLVDGWLGLQRNNSVNFGYNSFPFFFFFWPAYTQCVCLCVAANLIKTNFHLQRVAHQAISQAQSKSKNKKPRKKSRKKIGSKGVKTITRTSCKLTANTITNTQDLDGWDGMDGVAQCSPLNRKSESKGWRTTIYTTTLWP